MECITVLIINKTPALNSLFGTDVLNDFNIMHFLCSIRSATKEVLPDTVTSTDVSVCGHLCIYVYMDVCKHVFV